LKSAVLLHCFSACVFKFVPGRNIRCLIYIYLRRICSQIKCAFDPLTVEKSTPHHTAIATPTTNGLPQVSRRFGDGEK